MKKPPYFPSLCLLCVFVATLCAAHAANVQIKDLTPTTTLSPGDLTQVEQLIGGTYHDRQITIGDFQLSLSIAGSQLSGPYSSAQLTLNSGKLLGRASAGAGPAEELAADATLTLSSGTFGVNNATIAPAWNHITAIPAGVAALAGLGATQSANTVLAGPATGAPAAAAFRALAVADIPGLPWSSLTSGVPATAAGYGIANGATLDSLASVAPTGTAGTAVVLSQWPLIASPSITGGFYNATHTSEILGLGTLTGAVNYPVVTNATAGNAVTFGAQGSDVNVSLNLTPKGSGIVSISGTQVATLSQGALNALLASSGALAHGDVFYYNGTNVVRLPAGTSGQVLQTNGAGANPAWAASPGGTTILQSVTTGADAITSSTTLTNVPGMSVPLAAGVTYTFQALVYVQTASTTPGTAIGTAFSGTYSAYQDWVQYSAGAGPNIGNGGGHTAPGQVYSYPAVPTNPQMIEIRGTIVCTTAGNFTIQAAQNSASADATTILINSSLMAIPH